jgi:dihydropteroate synthase
MPIWKLAGLDLDLDRPLAAGIVNVTTDSMFEGARSGTPEQAIADGQRLADKGFDMLDVGAVAARSGPPVPPGELA